MRRAGLVLAGLSGCGIALAFLIELFLDPRIKRRSQLDREVKLPVYVNIPRHSRKSLAYAATGASGQGAELVKRNGKNSQLYYEALRDRLIVFFERINLRRKPKLVGITACHGGAGVSTVAEGLAQTLSETGGGKVLLVDLNQGQQAVHSYQSGRSMGALPEVLESAGGSRTGSTGDALYLASFGSPNGGYSHPTRSREFDQLIPKLKASDFDYIVFDMPPLTPTSVTFRVSGFLDKLIFVTESERTHMDSLKQAVKLLEETSSRVALVMNKTREYMPRWMRPPQ
jgi:Mrp family chromosome partitioning ATPase